MIILKLEFKFARFNTVTDVENSFIVFKFFVILNDACSLISITCDVYLDIRSRSEKIKILLGLVFCITDCYSSLMDVHKRLEHLSIVNPMKSETNNL